MSGDKDDYVYPGTDVLINKLDLRDGDLLMRFEEEAMLQRLREGFPVVATSASGYRALHKHLFQDVYAWAGHYRTVNLAKNNSFFCRPEYIPKEMDTRFNIIRKEDELKNLSPERFAERAAEHVSELNAVHPFREGNGRVLRAFLEMLAANAGHNVDLCRIDPEAWHEASVQGFQHASYDPMRQVILASLHPAKDRFEGR